MVPNCEIDEITENSRKGRMCKKPPLAKSRTLRSHSFQVVGPSLFNALPKEIRNMTKITKEEFKCKLDNFLTTIPDQPKVAGMTPSCLTTLAEPSNSLIDWIPALRREASWRGPQSWSWMEGGSEAELPVSQNLCRILHFFCERVMQFSPILRQKKRILPKKSSKFRGKLYSWKFY